MEVYTTEEQQVDAIRNWFKKNGASTIWMFVIVVGIVLGYRYWQHHKQVVAEQASEQYALMMYSIEEGDMASIETKANLLIEKYDNSPYAVLAAFALAKASVENDALDKAETHLQWVRDNSKVIEFKQLATMRLARVLAAQKREDAALALLDQDAEKANGYYSLQEELKGDLLMGKEQMPEAMQAYQRAWQTASKVNSRPLLRMKLEELGINLMDLAQ